MIKVWNTVCIRCGGSKKNPRLELCIFCQRRLGV